MVILDGDYAGWPEKFYTLPDCVMRCDGSRTTSLHHQGDKRPLLFLIRGLLLAVFMVSTVSMILATPSVSRVDFLIILLLLRGPFATGLKKSSLGFRSLNAYLSDCEQIGHYSGLLHGNLLHSLDVANSVAEGYDDLNVLDIRDGVPGITEIFHIVPETLIMLLLDGL
jgi:hypothetical protein